MGQDAIIYGRVVAPYLTWPSGRDGRLLQNRNRQAIAALPAEDQSASPLTCGMFVVPIWNGGLRVDQVIPFGGSLDDDVMSRDWWDVWLGKFESLLRRLYWKSVVLHMESTFVFRGHRMFQWLPTERAVGLVWADDPQPVGEWKQTVQVLINDQQSTQLGASRQEERPDSQLVRVRIPLPLLQYTDGKAVVEVGGDNVQAVLDNLTKQFAGFPPHLFAKKSVNIYLNGEDIRFLDKLTTVARGGDEVTIVPVISGG